MTTWPLIQPLLDAACRHFAASRSGVLRGYKGRNESRARALTVCLLAARYRWSFSEIARALNMSVAATRSAFCRRWDYTEDRMVLEAYQESLR